MNEFSPITAACDCAGNKVHANFFFSLNEKEFAFLTQIESYWATQKGTVIIIV